MLGGMIQQWDGRQLRYKDLKEKPSVGSGNELLRAAKEVTLQELLTKCKPAPLVTVVSDDTLQHALKVMCHIHFSSLPILDPPKALGSTDEKGIVVKLHGSGLFPCGSDCPGPRAADAGELRGFVDGLDLLTFLARATEHPYLKMEKVLDVPVGMLADESQKDPMYPLDPGVRLDRVLRLFSRGVHRAPVVDCSNTLLGICSQLDAIDFLVSLFDKGSGCGMAERSLEHYRDVLPGFWRCDGVTVTPETTMKEAIYIMVSSGLSVVAIVDKCASHAVVGQIAARDLGLIMPSFYQKLEYWLNATVLEFVRTFNKELPPLLMVQPATTLETACRKLSSHRKHHLWVVNESKRLLGCFSATDICRVVVEFKWPKWGALV